MTMSTQFKKAVWALGAALLLASPNAASAEPTTQTFPLPEQQQSIRQAGAPITVMQTINDVLKTHRSLKTIMENRQVLEHELTRAKAGFGPSVTVSGQGGVSVENDSTTRSHDAENEWLGTISASARLVQPIWDGFATRSRVRQAQTTLDSVKARVFDTATTLSLDGIIAHINLIRARTVYGLAERNVGQHQAILRQTQDRKNLGVDTGADVSQAQSRLQRALSSLSEAKSTLVVAEDTYSRLTGEPVASTMAQVPMPPEVYTAPQPVYELAEKHNPKIAAYLQDIRTARAGKELAQSAFFPTFNLEAGPSWSNKGGDWNRESSSFDVVGTMRWNIFNSGADVAATKAAGARVRQARQVMYDYMDDLKLDIESTWANYLAAQEQFRHYTDAVKFNQMTRKAYLEQFQMGKRSLLDVLDSENELYNSSTQAEMAKGNILIGAYRLCALTGNLLPLMGVNTAILNENPAVDPEHPGEQFEKGWFK